MNLDSGRLVGHFLHRSHLYISGLENFALRPPAERSGTTREIMDTLGDDDLKHAELYTRDAEQRQLAANAMHKVGSLKVVKMRVTDRTA